MSAAWIRPDWRAPEGIVAGTTLRTSRFEACGIPGEPCWLDQAHGATVVEADSYATPPRADASITGKPGRVCVVRTADCLPVLFCSTDGQEVAAAHAGWRGLVAGILEATIARMSHGPGELQAWLGPAISQAAFEVGGEVRDAFLGRDGGADEHFLRNARGRWQADLYGLARHQLAAAGLSAVAGGG